MDNLTFRNNLNYPWKLFTLFLYSLKLSMDNVTVYMETVYNSSNSMNSTRNLNKNNNNYNNNNLFLLNGLHVMHSDCDASTFLS